MSGVGGCGCDCDAVAAEGLEADIGVLLHRDAFITVGGGRRLRQAAAADCHSGWQHNLLSDHPLLVVSLKVPDDLRDHPDKLARNVRHILLCQLPLVLPRGGRGAERRLELRPEALRRIALSELTQALLAEALLAKALLAKALAALHGGVL